MWAVIGMALTMAEGDYGISLPVTVSGATMTDNDTLRFTFLTAKNGDTILEKEYAPANNSVSLEFTEAESALFSPKTYLYRLDWYQDGQFMCNVIPEGVFKVVDKA